MATFVCWRREINEVVSAKMPQLCCVGQDCDNETDLEAGISIHLWPLSDRGRLQWKKFMDGYVQEKLRFLGPVSDLLLAFYEKLFHWNCS